MARVKSALPAPRGRPTHLPSELEEESLVLIERTLGGRAALVAALTHAPASAHMEFILGLIGDPEQARTPLGQLCAQGGVTPGELLGAWRSGEILRGHVLATKQVVAALPGVVADVLKRAAPYEDTCSSCLGLGRVTPEPTRAVPNPEAIPCPACLGSGALTYEADLDRAKLALDLAQLTQRAGPAVQLNLNQQQAHFHGASAGGTLKPLMAASDKILSGDAAARPPLQAPPAEPIDADLPDGADSGAGEPSP